MNRYRSASRGLPVHQGGLTLVVSLVFLAVLTLAAVVAMQSTTLEQRMSAGYAQRTMALEISETARTLLTNANAFDAHVFGNCWRKRDPSDPDAPCAAADWTPECEAQLPDNISLNTAGCRLHDSATLLTPANYPEIDYTTEESAMSYAKSGNEAEIYVIDLAAVARVGAGLQKHRGYDGFGKGVGSGGSQKIYEVRSLSLGARGAAGTTSVDYVYVVR